MSRTPRDPAGVAVPAAPSTIAGSRPFHIQESIGPSDPSMVRVDATVLGHRHVANDRRRQRSLEAGRGTVDGLRWLVPGRWAMRFDVDAQRSAHPLRRIVVGP